MLSTRYHLITLVAIFLALGIGIVIGGAFGSGWMESAERSAARLLLDQYERQLQQTREWSDQLSGLLEVSRRVSPTFAGDTFAIVCPESSFPYFLARALQAEGATWRAASSLLDAQAEHADAVLVCSEDDDGDLSSWPVLQSDADIDSDRESSRSIIRLHHEPDVYERPEFTASIIMQLHSVVTGRDMDGAAYSDIRRYPGLE